jgi:hypothetical protein
MMDAMYTIEALQGRPTVAEVAQMLQVREADIDPSFGVVLIDPKRGLYTVRVRGQSGARPDTTDPRTRGPFSDPGIGLTGPVRP